MLNLTLSDGLTGETVHDVMTDFNGATWIATNSGINVYNGKQLDSFTMHDELGRPLEVNALAEVAGKQVYAATEAGLWRIVLGKDYFERMLPEVELPQSLLAVGDTLYIGSERGFMMYDGQRLHHQDVSVSRHGLDNIVRQYAMGNDGLVWMLGRFDLISYNPKDGRLTHHPLPPPVGGYVLTQFTCLGDGRFVVGTHGNGLFVCDIHAGTARHIEGIGNLVMTVRRSSDGFVCVSTDGSGAYLLEPSGDSLTVREHFCAEADSRHRLPGNGTYCYYRDAGGVNWFGLVRYGLVYTYHIGDLFRPFTAGEFTTEGINVRTFCRHGDSMVIGTQNGFYYIDSQTGQHRYFSSQELGGGHIVNSVCWWEGRFYIGTYDGGLSLFDTQTLTLSRQTFSPLLDNTSIGDLKAGPDGRLWIGSSRGLMVVDGDGQMQHFTEQNSHILGGMVLSITFDAAGNAWLTGEDGCSLYSVNSREIVDASFPQGFFNRQPWMRGAAGHNGLVFMRTGPQTFYTNSQMTDYGELQFPISFRDKWCRSFADDMNGHYFLTSERGLISFSYDMTEVRQFGSGEGLQGNFINDIQIEHSTRLWVATSQGLYTAELSDFLRWRDAETYKVQLFHIRVGSDLLSQADDYYTSTKHHIRLSWNMTSEPLQAEVLLPDYSRDDGRLFEYSVDGEPWQLVGNGQIIDVRRLLLGRHQLTVRQAGAKGTATTYTLTVVPSLWAVIELLLFVVAVVLLWMWWRWRKTTNVLIHERNEILDTLIEVEEKPDEEPADSPKYQKVKVDEAECADIVNRMKEYIERERIYTNQELKMKDLADVLHLSAPKLSQVFNLYLHTTYYDFINQYRLQEFKRLIAAGEYKRFTITALSEQCGFKRANFFSTFHKTEGMTPAEYLKKQGISV
jgi:ligand-binding sensor domain-containing protein/AraC-like DNA-binding protein